MVSLGRSLTHCPVYHYLVSNWGDENELKRLVWSVLVRARTQDFVFLLANDFTVYRWRHSSLCVFRSALMLTYQRLTVHPQGLNAGIVQAFYAFRVWTRKYSFGNLTDPFSHLVSEQAQLVPHHHNPRLHLR